MVAKVRKTTRKPARKPARKSAKRGIKPVKPVKNEGPDTRLAPIVPLELFRKHLIAIGGLGATGKQVLSILSTMGHKGMIGADPDVVEVVNIGTQGWGEKDIGKSKAEVLSHNNRRSVFVGSMMNFEILLPSLVVTKNIGKIIVFSCVDTMSARVEIWTAVKEMIMSAQHDTPVLLLDSRLSNGSIRIITADLTTPVGIKMYEGTLYSDTEAYQGTCTDNLTVYGAYVAAGLLISQMVNSLKKLPVVEDFVFETIGMNTAIITPQGEEEPGEDNG